MTLRLRDDLPNLRRGRVFRLVRAVLREACDRETFRICEFSVQGHHVHQICEADDEHALARGVHDFKIRAARRLNRMLSRCEPVFADRYHSRPLGSPREVRLALRYVLLNARRHVAAAGGTLARDWFDPCSSAAWFTGWEEPLPQREPWMREICAQAPARAEARSWLLTTGWRARHGLLSLMDTPGPTPPAV